MLGGCASGLRMCLIPFLTVGLVAASLLRKCDKASTTCWAAPLTRGSSTSPAWASAAAAASCMDARAQITRSGLVLAAFWYSNRSLGSISRESSR